LCVGEEEEEEEEEERYCRSEKVMFSTFDIFKSC
jgi:hypothetical protein